MKLNRELQRAILMELTSKFPKLPDENIYANLCHQYSIDEVSGNIFYLKMHGLLTVYSTHPLEDEYPRIIWQGCKPTQKAFDFLAEDGGLSAILGVVTIKLHADTIRDMLSMRIMENPNLSPAEKTTWIERLKSLSETSLEHLILNGLDYAIEHSTDGILWLTEFLSQQL